MIIKVMNGGLIGHNKMIFFFFYLFIDILVGGYTLLGV